jgi:hypothetical protein
MSVRFVSVGVLTDFLVLMALRDSEVAGEGIERVLL